MKNQFKKLICVLFGHKMDYSCMEHHNVQCCLRCGDTREFTYHDLEYWTDAEFYGLIGYPIWRIKNYILAAWIFIKLKTGKLKINDKNNEDDSLPF